MNHESLKNKIYEAIKEIRVTNNEIMYLWMYKRGLFIPELQLKDLWEIYRFDKEWSVIFPKRRFLRSKIENLAVEYGDKI